MHRPNALLLVILAACALCGCAGSARVPGFAKAQGEERVQGQVAPALEIMVPRSTQANADRITEIVDSLNALNPSMQITATISANYEADLAEALASSRPPDVFLVSGSTLVQLARDGQIMQIPDGSIDRSRLLQAAASGIEIQGEPHCFPHSIHTLALVYNLDLFNQADLDFPASGWDWDDMATAATSLMDPEQGTVGMVLDPNPLTWLPFYIQAGGNVQLDAAGETMLESGPARAAAEYVAALFSRGVAASPSELGASWSGEAFAGGKVGMIIAGDWIVPYLATGPGRFTYATAELPRGPAQRGNIAFTNCLAVHAGSGHPALALQLAAQLTAPEVLHTWTTGDAEELSVYNVPDIVAEEGQPQFAAYLRSLRYAEPWRLGDFAAEHGELFAEGLAMVASEEMTPEEFWPFLVQGGVSVVP